MLRSCRPFGDKGSSLQILGNTNSETKADSGQDSGCTGPWEQGREAPTHECWSSAALAPGPRGLSLSSRASGLPPPMVSVLQPQRYQATRKGGPSGDWGQAGLHLAALNRTMHLPMCKALYGL